MGARASVVAVAVLTALLAAVGPAAGSNTSDANVSRAISRWAKMKQNASFKFVAEGIIVEGSEERAAYGRLAFKRCDRPELPGRRVCIGTSAIKPLDDSSFTVAEDMSHALLEMRLRGRSHIVEWVADEEGNLEPGLRSPEKGRADVEREASASGEFFGSSVSITQLSTAVIEQVVDAVPEEVPMPFTSLADPLPLNFLSGSSSCWNFKPSERAFARKMNEARAEQGLPKLRLDPELSKVSRVHTGEMIDQNLLHHATSAQLTRRVTNWRVLGENVGVGGGVASLDQAFMDSPAHKANILFGFDFVGVGVSRSNGRMWVTVTFEKGSNPGTTLKMPRC